MGYLVALWFALIGLIFCLLLLVWGRRLSTRVNTEPARRPFESGMDPPGARLGPFSCPLSELYPDLPAV